MKPECLSEQLMFNTVRLVDNNDGCGTGFFFNFEKDGYICPTIITNKHVVNYNPNEEITFCLHLTDNEDLPGESHEITYRTNWFFHPSHDLCFCFAAPLFQIVKQATGQDVFFIANNMSIVATPKELSELRALEEVTMVGYPNGLWDQRNNFPIFRHGYTASHPSLDFNRPGVGLVDMACFPGSSGSPIYILNEASYQDKRGNFYAATSRVLLLGVLFAGPMFTAEGTLVVRNVPTQMTMCSQTDIAMNLGLYIHAKELQFFQEMIENMS